MKSLWVNEIFYSLQGEGARAGEPSTFIRLRGCSAQKHCSQRFDCDTDFKDGKSLTVGDIVNMVCAAAGKKACPWIVWTGGEPLDQLTPEIIKTFRSFGFKQALETSGVHPLPLPYYEFDWVSLSPKIPEKDILNTWELRGAKHCHEVRYLIKDGDPVPPQNIKAYKYYLSPYHHGDKINPQAMQHCINLCLENPTWNLSVQQHKIWGVR